MNNLPKVVIIAAYAAIIVLIAYGMASTANNDPQVKCLTRPWLDVKPPC